MSTSIMTDPRSKSPVADGLVLDRLHVRIPLPGTPRRWVHAARALTLHAPAGQVTAVVGESGCGKSVLGLAAMGLLPAGTRVAGSIGVDGDNLLERDERALSAVRGKGVGLVPQSAATHLTPVRTVGSIMTESLRHHGLPHGATVIAGLLRQVSLPPHVREDYPHELSGGMAQRVLVALTVALGPAVLIADEPTSALDDTTAQIVLTMLRTHADSGHAVVLITHDLAAARSVADRVAVMYAGELLEVGPTDAVLQHPAHDYSQALLAALPENGLVPPPGSPSSLVDPPPDVCAWHARAGIVCHHRPLAELRPGHELACQPETDR